MSKSSKSIHSGGAKRRNEEAPDDALLEYEDYLVICCPKCFGFPSRESTCCRPEIADSSQISEAAASSSGVPIPAQSSDSDQSSSSPSTADPAMLSKSSQNLVIIPCSLPPRRQTKITTVCEEYDDFEFDEGNRFIRDKDL